MDGENSGRNGAIRENPKTLYAFGGIAAFVVVVSAIFDIVVGSLLQASPSRGFCMEGKPNFQK